jgi:hypothetical protein
VKLGEALGEIADIKRRLAQLKDRIRASARFQEGEEPPEDATDLVAQGRALVARLETLTEQVNRTNSATELEPGWTITAALARRDAIGVARDLVSDASSAASGGRGWSALRGMRSELKQETRLDVPALRAEADDLARARRQLDTNLQQANWNTDLLE